MRENACDQVVIGFGFASHWLSRWREFFKPITENSKAKPKQFRITFDTQLQTSSFKYIPAVEVYLSLFGGKVVQ